MTSKPFRPLLACETPEPLSLLERLGHFPLLGSYKIDGIRATNVLGDQLVSRSGKPIPSAFAKKFAEPSLIWADGELVAQHVPPGDTTYNASYSAVMTQGSLVPLYYYVFDLIMGEPYHVRLFTLQRMCTKYAPLEVKVLEQRLLLGVDDLLQMEQEALDLGHEGLIVRRPDGRYKQNRSTLKEGLLIKVARRLTSEAEVIGFKEMMHNNNEAFLNEVGYTKRSKHQENLVGTGMLGAFVVRDLKTGVEFDLGNGEGLDHAARKAFWSRRLFMLGSLVKYSYKPYGTKNKPRQPLWLGPRSPDDM